MKAIVHVKLKAGVLDPQGKAIAHALHALGYDEVSDARVGKEITLELGGTDKESAGKRVSEMCEKLLANTVIERYSVDIQD